MWQLAVFSATYAVMGFHWWLRTRARRGDELGRVGRFVANPWRFGPIVITLYVVVSLRILNW